MFHTASKLPSRGKQKRTLGAWIPRLHFQNSCCKNLAIQYVFVLKSGLAKISFDAISLFSVHAGAMYNWTTAEFRGTVYPCCLVAVVVSIDESVNANDGLKLVVQRATSATGINSVLFTERLWSSKYHVIVPSSVKSPRFVVFIKDYSSKILETLPIEEWHKAF
jgi:hypothetical protein